MSGDLDLQERVVLILQAVATKLQLFGKQSGEQLSRLLRVMAEQSDIGMRALSEHFYQARQALARRSLQAAAAVGRAGAQARQGAARGLRHCGAEAAALRAKTLSYGQQLRPGLQRSWAALLDALEELQKSEPLRLRRPEDVSSLADDVARMDSILKSLMSAAQRMPTPAVAAGAFVAVRLAVFLNAAVDSAVSWLLHGRSGLSRLCLVASVAPGVAAVGIYRRALLQDVPAATEPSQLLLLSGEQGGTIGPWQLAQFQVASVVARNTRRLPSAFWLATSVAATVLLQATREVGERAVQSLRARMALVLTVATLGIAARGGGREGLQELLSKTSDLLPPALVKALHSAWYHLQAASRKAFERPGTPARQTSPAQTPPFVDSVEVVPSSSGQAGPVFRGGQIDDDIID